jgi:murein DD-endopeptidase MepM/ murein hydrolase activator NlpD
MNRDKRRKSALTLKKKVLAGAAALALLFGTAIPAAEAGFDELVKKDVPYFNLPPVGGNEPQHYVVLPGDTLTSIAGRFGVRADLLAAANGLADADYIEAGQELVIPGTSLTHVVRPGETLTRIARSYGVSLEDLVRVNGLRDENTLLAGQKLLVPAGGGVVLPAWNPAVGLPVNELPWPVKGWISSGFGLRDGHPHEGLDIAAEEGEPVRAVRAGRVAFAGDRGTYGLAVIIDHGAGLTTLYAHLSALAVREGQWVKEGQVIGRVGSTGRSTGPHLHLEVRLNGIPYDPVYCLKRMYA